MKPNESIKDPRWVWVYRIKTDDGIEHVTADPHQALFAMERHGKPVTVTSDRMAPGDYEAMPATTASHNFFKQS